MTETLTPSRSEGLTARTPSPDTRHLLGRAPLTPASDVASPPAHRMRRGQHWALALLALAIAGALWVALRPAAIAVETAVAARRMLRVTVDEDGTARIQDRFVVSAPMTGRLERIELRPGDDVRQRDTLARLLPLGAPMLDERTRREAEARLDMTLAAQKQTEAQLERAAAHLAFVKDDSARKHELETHGAIAHELVEQADLAQRTAASDLESLRFGLQVASHEIEMARATLGQLQGAHREQLEIRSPVDGKVLRVVQESEGVVQPGAPLLELGDPSALEVVVAVLTSDAVRIKPAARVLFERWGGEVLEGRVRRIEPSAFTRISALGVEEQRVNVIVGLTSPRSAWLTLGDGYRLEARLIVWEEPQVLQVPSSAVFRHGEGWATYRVVGERARLSPVAIGERTPAAVQIVRGLDEDDKVVLHPSDQVREGVSVSDH